MIEHETQRMESCQIKQDGMDIKHESRIARAIAGEMEKLRKKYREQAIAAEGLEVMYHEGAADAAEEIARTVTDKITEVRKEIAREARGKVEENVPESSAANRCRIFHCHKRGDRYCCHYCHRLAGCENPCQNCPDDCGQHWVEHKKTEVKA